MRTLPTEIIALLAPFAPLFSRPVWAHARVLVCGAILATGKRTVTAALRAMGLSGEKRFVNYHRVLNRAQWSGLRAARVLLGLLVRAFAPSGEVVLGIDETLERRRGDRIAQKGVYRDAARSSKGFFVKSSGLRWACLMLLAPVSWARRVWALPFLTVLAPSERYHAERGQRHKSLSDWARQMMKRVRRWLPGRTLVLVADQGYAALSFLNACAALRSPVTVVTRLRLDAALYAPAPPSEPGKKPKGRPRKKGERLPTLEEALADPKAAWSGITVARWYSQGARTVEAATGTAVWYHSGLPPVPIRWVLLRDPAGKFKTQALLCTDVTATPERVVNGFVLRWQLETTFQQVRTHLGVETQREWTPLAIARTTPALMGLFSLVTLLADQQAREAGVGLPIRQSAWYAKSRPTFSDAIASVRRQLWRGLNETAFCASGAETDSQKYQQALLEQFTEALCYTA